MLCKAEVFVIPRIRDGIDLEAVDPHEDALLRDAQTANRGDVNLFTRPRRFGKTLNMSMPRSFFKIGSDKPPSDGFAISEEKQLCEEYQAGICK